MHNEVTNETTAVLYIYRTTVECWYNEGVSIRDGLVAYKRGDYIKAVKWYRLAVAHGNAEAQFNLGYMYDKGKALRKTTQKQSNGID